ncbi:DUF6397 family protein [Streptomyces sp. CMB-StM0423]|uniref:DUF6397 family protein n=1 Tax=Streptomyces sp. CMB-StM0423 TaxID=2059884 RepID=UPI000C71369F|nr:DUF6397 family protein [Streptomyces sp. CMB-StM0423]AUH45250.1 hypothetical protein CXR04_32070 [Streptomyces sp. CMB-StM0423]
MVVRTGASAGARTAGAAGERAELLTFGRAAAELGLLPRELELAAQLGLVPTEPPQRAGGRRRVARAEVARLRAEDGAGGVGAAAALRERLRLVGTAAGAEELGISSVRFTRLARAGCFAPARFYVNRYRVVVWLYLAAEVERFGEREPGLLRGPLPPAMRGELAEGADVRARGWRQRRVEQLLSERVDPWERAGAYAAVLSDAELAEEVPDARERARVVEHRAELVATARGGSETARRAAEDVLLAESDAEALGYRLGLAVELQAARVDYATPSPPVSPDPSLATAPAPLPVLLPAPPAPPGGAPPARPAGGARPRRGSLNWLRRGRRRRTGLPR